MNYKWMNFALFSLLNREMLNLWCKPIVYGANFFIISITLAICNGMKKVIIVGNQRISTSYLMYANFWQGTKTKI
jgi:hypothetical protein